MGDSAVRSVTVRSAHAAREDRIFRWDDPPEGGHPGEDYWDEVKKYLPMFTGERSKETINHVDKIRASKWKFRQSDEQ